MITLPASRICGGISRAPENRGHEPDFGADSSGMLRFLACLFWSALSLGSALGVASGEFENLGVPVKVGGLMGCIVGPNGRGGEALYFNFNQTGGTLFLVQVDPDSGESRQFNAPQGPGAWALLAGPDNRIYLGTWDGGLVLRFDPKEPDKGLVVLGQPAASESYLWQFDTGKDGRIYACTYPGAKLVSLDPVTGKMEDLGRMHPTEMYSRSLAVGPNGKVYIGIGTTIGDLVVYDPASRKHRSLLPAGLSGTPGWTSVGVSRRSDGNVYAEFGTNLFRLDDETPVRISTAPDRPALALRDGRVVTSFSRGRFTLQDPRSGKCVERSFHYTANGDLIFLLGPGPSNNVYGSTVMPMEIFRHDPATRQTQHLGAMANGEVYSMLEEKAKLYLCYYPGAVMNLYDPANPTWNHGSVAGCNPVNYGHVGDGHLRPRAMIRGPDGRIYIGSEPPYGQHGGALAVWDPGKNRTIENYRHLITNQSIVSLAWEPKSGLIFGGSGNFGGGGTRPCEKEAKFFAFDPQPKAKVFEVALAPGARSYPATFAADGKVFTTLANRLFVFDPVTMSVSKTIQLPGNQVEISLGRSGPARLVGLTTRSVYVLDTGVCEIVQTAVSPVPVNCGFAVISNSVYFGSGCALWRYLLR
jgi:streptogramin lyase